jgi:hypothetical protein
MFHECHGACRRRRKRSAEMRGESQQELTQLDRIRRSQFDRCQIGPTDLPITRRRHRMILEKTSPITIRLLSVHQTAPTCEYLSLLRVCPYRTGLRRLGTAAPLRMPARLRTSMRMLIGLLSFRLRLVEMVPIYFCRRVAVSACYCP